MNWIKSRLNKDNFWNMIFFIGMSSGMSLSLCLAKDLAPFCFFCFWGTLILVPSIVASHNPVQYANKEFFNSRGKKLTTYPKTLFWLIMGTVAATALAGALIDSNAKNLPYSISFGILVTTFFAVPTLYFICINCPISILFNKQSWKPDVTGFDPNNVHVGPAFTDKRRESALNAFMHDNPITSPSYSGLSCNIHNSRHGK